MPDRPSGRNETEDERLDRNLSELLRGRGLVFIANRLSIAGLAVLALAMTCAVMLITNVLFGIVATTVVTTVLVLAMFLVLWAVLPLKRRLRYRNEGLPLLDPPADD